MVILAGIDGDLWSYLWWLRFWRGLLVICGVIVVSRAEVADGMATEDV